MSNKIEFQRIVIEGFHEDLPKNSQKKTYSFLVKDAVLPSNDPLCFRSLPKQQTCPLYL